VCKHESVALDVKSVRMSRKGVLVTSLVVLLAGVAGWVRFSGPQGTPEPVVGAIVLRRLLCQDQGNGLYRVRMAGLNQTDRDLRDLSVEFSLGDPEAISSAGAQIEYLARGGGIDLAREVKYDGEAEVCFVKFYRNEVQIPTTFRP
jgi:hypothetical protein